MIFDRKTGSFIREIGHYGRGPGEFRSTHGFFDEPDSVYYLQGWNGNLLKYSLDGKFLGSLKIPQYNSSFKEPSMADRFTCLTDQVIVCNFLNITGSETKSLMLFNNDGEIVELIPNKHIIKNVKQVMSTGSVSFHHFNHSVFFQEYFNDTVFRVTTESITPYFVLNRGKYRPPYESLWWPFEKSEQKKLIHQPIYLEGSGFISFDFYYLFNKDGFFALYDKKLKSLRITQNVSGIRNDIDNFMDLTFKSINESDELSCLIQSEDIIKWFENNKGRSNSLKTELQNLKKIETGDNPIVVISKYKSN